MEHELAVQANLLSLIKPILFDNLFEGHENCKMIIVIEESPKNFGWGSEIVASMAESGLANGKNIARIGAEELPIPSSTLLEEKTRGRAGLQSRSHQRPRDDGDGVDRQRVSMNDDLVKRGRTMHEIL